jgi:hypothetical protein
MGAYMNLIWGEMFGSWLLHLFIPFFMSRIVTSMFYDTSVFNRMLILIGFTMIFSFILQFILLIIIQSSSCSTVKHFDYIAYGSIIGTIIVGAMMCIPAFVEPMRVVVSQLYAPHKPLMTPQLEELQKQLLYISLPHEQKGGASPEKEQPESKEVKEPQETPQQKYDKQTFTEFTIGSALWAAFGGAYGVGIGSLYAGKC